MRDPSSRRQSRWKMIWEIENAEERMKNQAFFLNDEVFRGRSKYSRATIFQACSLFLSLTAGATITPRDEMSLKNSPLGGG